MLDIKRFQKEASVKLIALKRTSKVSDQNHDLPAWAMLKDQYEEHSQGTWLDRAMVSLLNSIVTQQRVCFVLAKRSFRELCQGDQNWPKPIGLKDSNWPMFLHTITQGGLVELVHESVHGRRVYRVVAQELLDLLCINPQKQLKEAIAFADSKEEEPTSLVLPDESTPVPLPTVQAKPENVPTAVQEAPAVSFGDVLNNWLSEEETVVSRLLSKVRLAKLQELAQTCLDAGIPRTAVSLSLFKKKVLAKAGKKFSSEPDWQQQTWDDLESAISTVYAPIAISKAPKKFASDLGEVMSKKQIQADQEAYLASLQASGYLMDP